MPSTKSCTVHLVPSFISVFGVRWLALAACLCGTYQLVCPFSPLASCPATLVVADAQQGMCLVLQSQPDRQSGEGRVYGTDCQNQFRTVSKKEIRTDKDTVRESAFLGVEMAT